MKFANEKKKKKNKNTNFSNRCELLPTCNHTARARDSMTLACDS